MSKTKTSITAQNGITQDSKIYLNIRKTQEKQGNAIAPRGCPRVKTRPCFMLQRN